MEPFSLSRAVLLVVDAQRGFSELCPQELPVPGALGIVAPINRLLDLPWKRIDASQDWHPANHCSFLGQRDNLYPPHCVMNTPGSDFLPGLNTHRFHAIWRKGFDPEREAYALTAEHPAYVELLRGSGITTAVVCGLATNICCYYVAKDLREKGLRVLIVEDASAGIDVPAAGLFQEKTRKDAQAIGIEYITTNGVLRGLES
jgi:nicotinamidase/pyrazinamidase